MGFRSGKKYLCTEACARTQARADRSSRILRSFGETIKVHGKTKVTFTDEILNTTADSTFIVANKVTRPILSGGELNDSGCITISSSRGAFVVEEGVAREACEALMPYAKLAFTRAGPGRLYEHQSNLVPQAALFFKGRNESEWTITEQQQQQLRRNARRSFNLSIHKT